MKNTPQKLTAPELPPASSYKIITAVDVTPLEERVNEAIASGFLPVGNVTMCGNLLVQGMLKKS